MLIMLIVNVLIVNVLIVLEMILLRLMINKLMRNVFNDFIIFCNKMMILNIKDKKDFK